MLKNTGIRIYEDLTKHQHEILMLAREKYGYKNAWTAEGRVYVLKNVKHCVKEAEDL